jgi:signal transduction histidine kinase
MTPRALARWGLASRLLAGILAVVVVGVATAWAVAAAIGPAIFHDHMVEGGATQSAVTLHAEEAFRSASALSMALALVAALCASVVVSIFLTRRIAHALAPVTQAAERVAGGDYAARVPVTGIGSEFDDLAGGFNTMAAELSRIEDTRTQMLGDLAHEMRTPVATLDAYLEAISDGVEQADDATLTMLREQVSRLARLGEDIALVSTAEEGRLTMRRENVSVAELVSAAAAQAAGRYADGGVRLDVQVTDSAANVDVLADTDRIAQVLTNLLDNALRHTRSGGNVHVRADRYADTVLVSVADDGDGIPAEALPRVFDRFYRVDTARDRAHGGSGVGLAIVKAITVAHGGTVSADSDGPGRGATITITLPVVECGITEGASSSGAP